MQLWTSHLTSQVLFSQWEIWKMLIPKFFIPNESEIENKQTYLSTTKTNSCESASTQLPVKLMLLFRRQINNNYSLLKVK